MDDKIPEGLEDLLKGIIEDDEKIPEGLDDLLDSVRGDSKSSGGGGGGALATIPKKPDDLVDEEIDSQILSILGLEDVFDLTYEEYASLLKEAAIKGRMADSQMTTESIELVTNELKRVKGKTGKFKVKPKKVDINKVLNRKPGAIVKVDSLKPKDKESEAAEDKSDSDGFKRDVNDGINKILGSLITIKSVLDKQNTIEKNTAKSERKTQEKEEKRRRENKLEKKKEDKKKTKKLPEAKPIGGFFDNIKRFFTNILIGGTLLKLVNWIQDPDNKKSIDKFKNFMVDNAPLILGGLLAIASLPIATTLFGLTNTVLGVIATLISAGNLIRSSLNRLKPTKTPTKTSAPTPSQMQGGSNTGIFYGKNVDPKTGRQLRSGPSISRYNESFSRIIRGDANIGDKLRVGVRDSVYRARNFLDKANLKLSSSWEFVKSKFSPLVSNKIKSFAPKLRGLGFGAFRALGSILRLIGLGFLVAELQQDWNNKDYYAIIVKLAAYGAGWIVTSLGFLTSAALVSTGLGSPAGIALSVASMAAGAGTDAAIRHFLLKDRKKNQSTLSPKDPYAGADGLQRQLDDLTKPPAVQPRTPLMPGLPPSAAQPGTGPADNPVSGGSVVEYITGDATHPNFEYDGHGTTSNYHDHIAFRTREEKERAKLALQQAGIQIGSESRPWDTDSYHSQGLAIDIPGAQWGGRGAIGETEYAGSRKVRAVLAAAGFSGGGIDTSGSVRAPSPSAQIARTPVSSPSISSPTGRSGIGILPMPMGGGGSKGSTSGSGSGQTKLPFFSSEDPNNMTMMVVKGIYNVVG
jgi:hypothetical protein